METKLSPQQKDQLRRKVIAVFLDDFDEELSDFKADHILDAFISKIGPEIYNIAIQDMKAYLINQIDDIDAIFKK